ncbi:patronin isoform X2 [Linepithema humile]|uniref:patronin isoform X2 n=1 Tax=Linepithema humile TaxID=83485 RepID=UPI0006230281|nr:PREDICTED: patronin isoform X1 [Linepithema humile]XP_012216731.1 PREDICTED: patronin isoform X1 [Linepithema humile]XP_012216739.1 PREDICTED: patronin isoform X1 [Linepithema humile]XP_012216750.1 PREDICTED: patronin isoform X1 [Linepithema humile]
MWNTISRLFAKGNKTAVVQETAAPPLPPSTTTTTAAKDEQQQQQQRLCNGVADDDAPGDGTNAAHVFYDATMDRGASADDRRRPAAASAVAAGAAATAADQQSGGGDSEHFPDAYDSRQAKQRASVKWLLSKAYNNRVPEKLREPYYRDHEEQEHLKPQIVHALSNAELYCLALANIYSDPNYHNQNHYGILQALARKGVYVTEQNNTQLTETILIQNSPLKMSAHMAVIEGLMVLYAKEVVTGDRVVSAIRRFDPQAEVDVPSDHEKGLLLWINHASRALIAKIQSEEGAGDKTRLPELPAAKDFQSLCDGVGLAAVVAFYCPGELSWMEIRVSKRPSVADALHNLSLVHAFCIKCLPYSIFHMQPEDVTYMRGSMKQNLVVFLADMYNVLEIHPAKCVRYPGEERAMQYLDACPRNSHGVAHKRSLPQSIAPIPDLRSNLSVSAPGFTVTKSTSSTSVKKSQSLQQTTESHPYDDRRAGSEESFVVHRGKGIPTLSSVADDKSAARTEAAGRPSNWEDQRRSSYAGRRSRRNSITDDSQLTIENFGGSQDNLHNFGRNPDKEVGAHIGKRSTTEPTLPARSSVQDVYGSGVQHIIADNGYGGGEEPPRLRRQASNSSLDTVALRHILHSSAENDGGADIGGGGGDAISATKFASFANLSRQSSEKGINFTYMEQERLDDAKLNRKHGQSNGNGNGEKKTTFATLPNTTTWQQQSSQQSQQMEQHSIDENGGNTIMASQLNNIRLKLEEKRRHIENEKRRMEVVMSKQRQKVGKAAFLQAVTKGKVKSPSSSTSGGDSPAETIGPPTPVTSGSSGATPTSVSEASSVPQQPPQEKPQRPFSLKEISEDVRDVEHKWLEHDGNAPFIETRRTPDIENMDPEQYRQSISQMNNSLSEIQADIQRLSDQQNQIQQQHLIQHQKQMQQQLQQLHSLSQQHMQTYGMPPMNPLTPRLQESQFYLHDQPQVQRRMWGQPAPAQSLANEMAAVGYQQPMDSRFSPQPAAYQQDMRMYADPTRTWAAPHPAQKGFVLHDTQEPRYLNGGDHSLCNNQMSHPGPTYPASSSIFNQTQAPSASPQHRNAVHRISQLISESPEPKRTTVHHIPISCESPTEKRQVALHTPVPAPPVDDMKPQNISFIGNDDDLAQGIRNLNITSGSRTYRIPSPTRPTISQNSFQPHPSLRETASSRSATPDVTPLDHTDAGEKGFYISFDNDAPKKPKPTLRVKRTSPKKERSVSSYIEHEDFTVRPESPPANTIERQKQMEAQRELERERLRQAEEREQQRQEMRDRELKREMERERQREKQRDGSTDSRHASGVGLMIGNQLTNPDPNSMDEMEKKKERIMLMSLQRRQRQEEMKERKEAEAQAQREKEKLKAEERARKKEEERQRRAAILEHHKVKKAIEEAEREGKVIDKELLNAINPAKLRNKTATARPRPKTIHGDAGAVLDSGALTPSRGKKGSSSNLSTASLTSPTMRRDYYRGSQDSLTTAHLDDRRCSGPLYRGGSLRVSSVDSPDDGRGSSPCRSVNQLGRRGSYKTSRDAQESQQQVRGRPKYQTYQNFKGRKSNSLMNLCDSDSGLGRSTPPRRAASPGIGSMRHLTSPSGPGSLPPALMTSKKRVYDDGSSDISSTPSSMMDYNGPRLYKLPIAKSNRNIMLNAVEYCVFPGTVNREAKSRVLEEIGRSESKHFLILFRDAGCQFRALYSYCPEREEVAKLYGTGPKQVIDNMFDKFFKYNSSGKCFSQVHTKHLTVTIDAFTIHNSLWQGKKVNLPNKKDIPLVI